jgi:predicted nucleotidyltransferase
MVATRYSVEELKEIIAPIAEKYHISKVYLFGSFARGDYNEHSDVDLRIEKGELKGMFALCGFYTEVEEVSENWKGFVAVISSNMELSNQSLSRIGEISSGLTRLE